MLSKAAALLEAGLALKARQFKLASQSYLSDRADQGKDIVTSYALASALFAIAAIFFITACLVGLIALYRWIALWHGQFIAFGCIGGLLLALAAICVAVAVAQIKRRPPKVSSLSSRLLAAARTSPVRFDRLAKIDAARSTDPAGLPAADNPSHRRAAGPRIDRLLQHRSDGRTLLLVAATLLGWAVARNRGRSRRAGP